jgi:hypothetical protein
MKSTLEEKLKKEKNQTHNLTIYNKDRHVIVQRYFVSHNEVEITSEKIHAIGMLIVEELSKQELNLFIGVNDRKKEKIINSRQELELILEVEKILGQNDETLIKNKEKELLGASYRLSMGEYASNVRFRINLKAILPSVINEIRNN